MSTFNQRSSAPRSTTATSPIVSTGVTAVTHQGGLGIERSSKSEIFLLAVSLFGESDTFYEKGSDRVERLAGLARYVAAEDLEWTKRFVAWLRGDANMRSAALVVALEGAKTLIDAGIPGTRELVASALQRADEPGEALGYWTSRYGRRVPKPVKRGIADATTRLLNEYTLSKYDSDGAAFRQADVIQLVHPAPRDEKQNALFKFVLDRRFNSNAEVPAELEMLVARRELLALSPVEKRELLNKGELTDRLRAAGLTWEALSGSLAGGMDAKAWEAVIPTMGYMALMRNLRNFDEAGISQASRDYVAGYLTDPARVEKSRQLPFRFLSAYYAAPSDFWKPVLNKAIMLAIGNVPVFDGETEVMIDSSGSMKYGLVSTKSTMAYADIAALFAIVVAKKNGLDRVFGYDSKLHEFKLRKGADVLAEVERYKATCNGGATMTASCARDLFAQRVREGKRGGLRRLIVVSDEQIGETDYWYSRSGGSTTLSQVVPAETMLYTFNIGGYRVGHTESGMKNRHTFTGMNDSSFKTIPLIERGRAGDWPF